ncbi:hypothetical protein CSKR_113654 [Clonorchis sinensis]|uniref:Uncharacterized protein n=3 Tax=Clonorchis sinensis TaxID=79923 RepID=G7YUL4_CLOSI|nr:hypothetical protein CSKR_113654 [Clonorchis sinensis]GAA56644.1 hypothetical protein CLF_111299 [Clonorchis sinensis]
MENGLDEDDTLDESIGEVEKPVKLRPKPSSTRPEGRAPTMTIEAVRVGRPMKVLALLASILSLILFLIGTVSTSWMFTNNLRLGMFQQCDQVSLIEMDPNPEFVCSFDYQRTWEQWTCLVLDAVAISFTLIGVILMIAALLTLVVKHKYKLYKAVLSFNSIAWFSMLTNAILFPVSFYYRTNHNALQFDYKDDEAPEFMVGWSYVVCTCGLLPLLLAIVLLALDRKSEEIIYQETIFQDSVTVADCNNE